MDFSEHVAKIFEAGLDAGIAKEIYYGDTLITASMADLQNLGNVSQGQSHTAQLSIKKEDIAAPAYGDLLIIDAKTWKVIRIISQDDYVINLEIREEARNKIGN